MDRYTEELIRQSYMGTWDAMNNLFSNDQATLTAWKTVGLLEATVNYSRLYLWLAAQLLVTISGIALWLLQWQCKRPIVIDYAAVSLMVNPGLVSGSGNQLTAMSYVSGKDFPGGRLKLDGARGSREPYTQQFKLVPPPGAQEPRKGNGGLRMWLSERLGRLSKRLR
jgi:hypothetical protein